MTELLVPEDWLRAMWETAYRVDATLPVVFCRRCNRRPDHWPFGARCCTWWGGYRGRHRRRRR